MSSSTKHVVCTLIGLVVLAPVTAAGAQRGRPQPKPERVEADGTVEGVVAPGVLKILTSTNQTWFFKLSRETEIHVTGTAEVDYLRPGLFIEFTADLDRRGRSPNKLSELAIFTPTMQKFPGIFPAGGFGGPDAAPAQPAPAAKRDPNATTPYKVLGRITSLKNKALTVNAGRGVVRVELADEVKIAVDVADLSVVQKGDKIKADGTSARQGFAQARTISIELSAPLAAPKKKVPRKAGERPEKPEKPAKERRKPGRRPGKKPKTDEPEEPAAEEEAEPKQEAKTDRAEQIVQRLRLEPAEAQGKKPIKLAFQAGQPEVFNPSKPEPVKNIEELLGKPEKSMTRRRTMTPPGGGEPKQVTLTLLVCQGVKVVVDEQGVVQFYRVDGSP